MARIELPQFIWIPPDRDTKWIIKIDGTDISDDILSATFTRGIIGEEVSCEIELENSGEAYTGRFSANNIIQFLFDFTGGTTIQWEGKLEEIKSKIGIGFTYNLKGSHYQADLLDVTVTAEFNNSNVSDILKNIIDNNLIGFTYNNVETISVTITKIKWNNKLFADCVLDLMNFANADCFVDNNKDFHFFVKNTKENENEAVVWDDGLIELHGLGADSIDVRNKVIAYGEAGGLPVLHTSTDSSSQSTFGVKERVITDTSIISDDQAKEAGDAEIELTKNPPTKGSAETLLMPLLNPGDSLYVVSPPHDITDKFRLVKYTFKLPNETMEVIFHQDIGIPQLFKDRIAKDIAQETITNPFKMLYSYNFTLDDLSQINESASSNISVLDGKLKVMTGSFGIMISKTKTTISNVTKIHLLVIGEAIPSNVTFHISADGTDNYQQININEETIVSNTGTQFKIKVTINSASVLIDSLALLFK